MSTALASIQGILVKGYGVASGPSADYPYGALERQIPLFKARGLDLSQYFRGTLNIDIRPLVFELINPEFTFRDVRWTDLHPPETFSFVRCSLIRFNTEYDGWIYYPHPETKTRNFQNQSLLEVIACQIPAVKYGDQLAVLADPARITISAAR
jgi:hypothetical protein